jgi:hypothetical protein
LNVIRQYTRFRLHQVEAANPHVGDARLQRLYEVATDEAARSGHKNHGFDTFTEKSAQQESLRPRARFSRNGT